MNKQTKRDTQEVVAMWTAILGGSVILDDEELAPPLSKADAAKRMRDYCDRLAGGIADESLAEVG